MKTKEYFFAVSMNQAKFDLTIRKLIGISFSAVLNRIYSAFINEFAHIFSNCFLLKKVNKILQPQIQTFETQT